MLFVHYCRFAYLICFVVLSSQRLSGSIPSAIGALNALTMLRLSWNNYRGTPLPPELGLLVCLKGLYLDTNYFTGTVPMSMVNLTGLKTLSLDTKAYNVMIPPEPIINNKQVSVYKSVPL